MTEIIIKKYFDRTQLIGISAGDIQLGWETLDKPISLQENL